MNQENKHPTSDIDVDSEEHSQWTEIEVDEEKELERDGLALM